MKVYAWVTHTMDAHVRTAPNGGRQARFIVAAKSGADAARLFGAKRPRDIWNFGETWNAAEVAAATAQPRVILSRGLDDYRGPFVPSSTRR